MLAIDIRITGPRCCPRISALRRRDRGIRVAGGHGARPIAVITRPILANLIGGKIDTLPLGIGATGCEGIHTSLSFMIRFGVAQSQASLEVGRCIPLHNAAHGPMIVGTAIGLPRRDILDIAVVAIILAGNPCRQPLCDRPRQRAFDDGLIETAISARQIAAECLAWLIGEELHRATRRIPAEEGALGTAQHLGAVEIEDRKTGRGNRACVAVVLIDGDRGFLLVAIVVLTDAADIEHHLRTAIGVELEIGYGAHEIGGIGDVECTQLLAGQHREGNADITHLLFTALGGHHDVARNGTCLLLGRPCGFGLSMGRQCHRGVQRQGRPTKK